MPSQYSWLYTGGGGGGLYFCRVGIKDGIAICIFEEQHCAVVLDKAALGERPPEGFEDALERLSVRWTEGDEGGGHVPWNRSYSTRQGRA